MCTCSNTAHCKGRQLTISRPLWIDGKQVTDTTGKIEVIAPKTQKTAWHAAAASKKEAIQAAESSERAFKSWKKTKPQEIRRILLKAADILEGRIDELTSYHVEETGAPDAVSKDINLPTTIEMLRDVAGRLTGITGSIPVTSSGGALVFKEPMGVILGIAPWYVEGF